MQVPSTPMNFEPTRQTSGVAHSVTFVINTWSRKHAAMQNPVDRKIPQHTKHQADRRQRT